MAIIGEDEVQPLIQGSPGSNGGTDQPTPARPDPIKVFSASIYSALKFELLERLPQVMWPFWTNQKASIQFRQNILVVCVPKSMPLVWEAIFNKVINLRLRGSLSVFKAAARVGTGVSLGLKARAQIWARTKQARDTRVWFQSLPASFLGSKRLEVSVYEATWTKL